MTTPPPAAHRVASWDAVLDGGLGVVVGGGVGLVSAWRVVWWVGVVAVVVVGVWCGCRCGRAGGGAERDGGCGRFAAVR